MMEDGEFGFEITKGVIWRIVSVVAGFISSVVFANLLDPSVYGYFFVLLSAIHVLDNPIAGCAAACKKRISENSLPQNEIVTFGILVAIAFSILLAVCAVIISAQVDVFERPSDALPFALLFFTVSLYITLSRMISGTQYFSMSMLSDAVRSILAILFQLFFVMLGFGALGMAYGLITATLIVVPIAIYILGYLPAVPSRETVRSIWTYSKFSVPNGFVGEALSNFDLLLLGFVATSAAAGQYKVALTLTMPAVLIGAVTSSALMTRVSLRHEDGRSIGEVVNETTGISSLISTPVFFGSIAVAEPLLSTIYSPAYAETPALLIGLAFYQLLYTQTMQFASTIAGMDRPDLNLRISTLSLVINIVLGYLLLVEIGIIGVVLGTVIAEIVRYSIYVLVVHDKSVNVQIITKPFRQQLVSGIVMFLVVYILVMIFDPMYWLELCGVLAAGVLTYFALLLTLSDRLRQGAYTLFLTFQS